MIRQVIEGTILLIIIYLVLSNGQSFSAVTRSIGGVYVGSVKALQGR
jgi:hypothetical protein